MSLMAGFDLVTEISNETILKLLKKNLQIGGEQVNPPFELSLPIAGGGANGTAHLIVNDLQVDLNANDTITLALAFNHASVMISSPLALTICPLDGSITINAALQLVNSGGSNKQVSVNTGAATVAIDWSSQANNEITNDLSGTPISPATFKTLATQALTGYVQSTPAPTIPLAFKVVPGTDGSLTPSLQFEKLEVHCIPNANRSKQALGLFGILLAANHSHGDHNQKTDTAITAAHDGVCISISPGAFHSLVFCPAIATALGTSVSHLPGSCGPAGGFDKGGVTITSITDSFANGHININGGVSKSGTCYDATGTFHGTLTLTVSGSNLTPNLNMDEPDIDISIPWYCWLAAAFVLGPIGIAIAAVISTVGDTIASSLAGDAIKEALGTGIPGISLGGLSGASFSSTKLTTEGLSLQGTVPVFVSHPYVPQAISIDGSVITTNSQVVGSGTYHAKLWCMDNPKDYPYTEYSQQQTGTYYLSGSLVTLPLTPRFTLSTSGGAPVPLTGSNGTVAIPNVTTHYPTPLATGGTAMTQTVHVAYSISGGTLRLTNTPSEGNYTLHLDVTATDCTGQVVKNDTTHNDLTSFGYVQFEGDHVDIGGGYAADVQACGQLLRQMVESIADKYKQYQNVPIWEQVNYPPPERVITYIRDLVSTGLPQMDEILVASKIAHGNSFYRAIFSPVALQPGSLRGRGNLAVNEQRVVEVAEQLSRLSNLADRLQGARGLAEREIGG